MIGSKIPPELSKSPVFSRDAQIAAGLAGRSPYRPALWGIFGVAVLGLATFYALSSYRTQRPQPQPAQQPTVQEQTPVETAVVEMPLPEPQQPAAPPAPEMTASPSWRAPAMVVDFSQSGAAPAATAEGSAAAGGVPTATANTPVDRLTADENFAARAGIGGTDTAHATQLRNLAFTAPQGTVIPAVLETAINSDLPGFVRAVVSRDVRGFDGSTVLIPRGSKLVGQYRSAVALSQTRAFVVWSRILTPDGVAIDIGSPATDRLGRGGLDGETDTHFFQRFGSAILLSVMSAGLNALAQNGNNTAIIIGSSQEATEVAGIALQRQIDIPVTIKVPQGTPLQVFVTRDLDFSSAANGP